MTETFSATPELLYDFVYAKLASDVGSSDATITVDNTSLFPSNAELATGNFWMTIESTLTYPHTFEIVRVTNVNVATNTLTVVRGERSGTSTHAANTYIKSTVSAELLRHLGFGYGCTSLPTDVSMFNEGDRIYNYTEHKWYYLAGSSSADWTEFGGGTSGGTTFAGEFDKTKTYSPGTLLTYENKLYLCTTSYTPSAYATPYRSYVNHAQTDGAAAHVSLPTDTNVGDTLLAVIAATDNSSSQSISGSDWNTMAVASLVGANLTMSLQSHTVVQSDVTNGYIAFPTNGNLGGWSATLINLGQGATYDQTQMNPLDAGGSAVINSSTAASIASDGAQFAFIAGVPTTATTVTWDGTGSLSSVATTATSSPVQLAWGTSTYSGTTVPTRTFTITPAFALTSGSQPSEATLSITVPMGGAYFDLGCFTFLADIDGPREEVMRYHGAYVANVTYERGDVMTDPSANGVYVCTTDWPGRPVSTRNPLKQIQQQAYDSGSGTLSFNPNASSINGEAIQPNGELAVIIISGQLDSGSITGGLPTGFTQIYTANVGTQYFLVGTKTLHLSDYFGPITVPAQGPTAGAPWGYVAFLMDPSTYAVDEQTGTSLSFSAGNTGVVTGSAPDGSNSLTYLIRVATFDSPSAFSAGTWSPAFDATEGHTGSASSSGNHNVLWGYDRLYGTLSYGAETYTDPGTYTNMATLTIAFAGEAPGRDAYFDRLGMLHRPTPVSITSNLTITDDTYDGVPLVVDASNGNITIDLSGYISQNPGATFIFRRHDLTSGTNTVTLTGTIEGASSYSLSDGHSVTIMNAPGFNPTTHGPIGFLVLNAF